MRCESVPQIPVVKSAEPATYRSSVSLYRLLPIVPKISMLHASMPLFSGDVPESVDVGECRVTVNLKQLIALRTQLVECLARVQYLEQQNKTIPKLEREISSLKLQLDEEIKRNQNFSRLVREEQVYSMQCQRITGCDSRGGNSELLLNSSEGKHAVHDHVNDNYGLFHNQNNTDSVNSHGHSCSKQFCLELMKYVEEKGLRFNNDCAVNKYQIFLRQCNSNRYDAILQMLGVFDNSISTQCPSNPSKMCNLSGEMDGELYKSASEKLSPSSADSDIVRHFIDCHENSSILPQALSNNECVSVNTFRQNPTPIYRLFDLADSLKIVQSFSESIEEVELLYFCHEMNPFHIVASTVCISLYSIPSLSRFDAHTSTEPKPLHLFDSVMMLAVNALFPGTANSCSYSPTHNNNRLRPFDHTRYVNTSHEELVAENVPYTHRLTSYAVRETSDELVVTEMEEFFGIPPLANETGQPFHDVDIEPCGRYEQRLTDRFYMHAQTLLRDECNFVNKDYIDMIRDRGCVQAVGCYSQNDGFDVRNTFIDFIHANNNSTMGKHASQELEPSPNSKAPNSLSRSQSLTVSTIQNEMFLQKPKTRLRNGLRLITSCGMICPRAGQSKQHTSPSISNPVRLSTAERFEQEELLSFQTEPQVARVNFYIAGVSWNQIIPVEPFCILIKTAERCKFEQYNGVRSMSTLSYNPLPEWDLQREITLTDPVASSVSEEFAKACGVCAAWLNDSTGMSSRDMDVVTNTVRRIWFEITSRPDADSSLVDAHIRFLRQLDACPLERVVNMVDEKGNTALHYAVSHACWSVVGTLLTNCPNLNVDQFNAAGYTACMLAAVVEQQPQMEEDQLHLERMFSRANLALTSRNEHKQSVLMLAAIHGHSSMVRSLVTKHRAPVNQRDAEGSTALMAATEHNRANVVRVLLCQPDIDAEMKDNDGCTALDIALTHKYYEIALMIYAKVKIKKLASQYSQLSAKSEPQLRRPAIKRTH